MPVVKNSPVIAGDAGSNPGSGRSPGKRNGNPLQYSCLENPMDGGAWLATVHEVAKSWTRLSNFTFTFKMKLINFVNLFQHVHFDFTVFCLVFLLLISALNFSLLFILTWWLFYTFWSSVIKCIQILNHYVSFQLWNFHHLFLWLSLLC